MKPSVAEGKIKRKIDDFTTLYASVDDRFTVSIYFALLGG